MSFDKRITDQGGWLRRPPTNLSVAILFVSICLLFGLLALAFTDLTNRVSSDEHATCIIQARGLPASHELAASMADIHKLLTVPPVSAAQKARQKATPAHVLAIVKDLNAHLAVYQGLESKQPATRSC
jgi:hypothetical protein